MNKLEKLLVCLGFDVVIDEHPFGDLRVVQRGKKQILQRLTDASWVEDAQWKYIKEVEL
jgi:hypothetical protein